MKTKPKHLNIAAAALLVISFSLPIQIMLLYGHPPTEISAIAAKLSPLNWLLMILGPCVATLIYRASPLCIAAAPLFAVLVIYNNWFVSRVGHDFSAWTTGIASGLFCFAIAGIFTREVRALIANPSRRWWMTPARKTAEVSLRMRVLDGRYKSGKEEFYTVTYDISETGAFVPYGRETGNVRELKKDAAISPFSIRNLAVGTHCYICLNLKELAFVHCRAEIIRVTTAQGQYPAGVGIRFLGLSGQEKRMIAAFMEQPEAATEKKKIVPSDSIAA